MSKRILALLISFTIGFAVFTPAAVSAYYNDTQTASLPNGQETEITQEQPAPPYYENGESAEVPEETPTTGNETPETPATDYETDETPETEETPETPAPPTTPPTDENELDELDETDELENGEDGELDETDETEETEEDDLDETDETELDETDETETDDLDETDELDETELDETDETDETEELEEPETDNETQPTERERFTIEISPAELEINPGATLQFTYILSEHLPAEPEPETTESEETDLPTGQAGETEELNEEQPAAPATPNHSITWSIAGSTSEDTTIDENGLLTVSPQQPPAIIFVQVAAIVDGVTVATATATVTVVMGFAPAQLTRDLTFPPAYFPRFGSPNFTEIMPEFETLMDPFQFFGPLVGENPENFGTNGRVVTPADWEQRREEIRNLIMYYYYGFMWPTTAEHVTVNTTERPTTNGTINITVNEYRLDGTPTTATADVALQVWLPTFEQLAANGFWDLDTNTGTGGPLLIGTNHTVPVARRNEFLERGIGVLATTGAGFFPPPAAVPGNETRTGMYFDLFPFDPAIPQYNTGSLMANSWVVSRIIDAFELTPEWGVNSNAIATLGNSFAGKRALFAGVMDERVALTIPHESGGDGGVAPFRHSHAGRIHFYNLDGVNRVQ